MKTTIYYLSVATLLTHELDAVKHAEWSLLFLIGRLPDTASYPTFVLLHIPLIVILFWLSHHQVPKVQSAFRLGAAGFTVLHAVIHYWLSETSGYTFEGWLSDGLIFGAAGFGVLYCLLSLSPNKAAPS